MFHNTQNMETTYGILKYTRDKVNVVHFTMEYYSAVKINDIRKFEDKQMEL